MQSQDNTDIGAKAESLDENGDKMGQPAVDKEELLRKQRREQLNRHGVIPEFIKLDEIYQVYTAFTQANLKNSILQQKQALKQAQADDKPLPESIKETELKEDVLII